MLDLLPGTTQSTSIGIDDANRVVGFSGIALFPSPGAPFLWSEADGLVDLSTLGFPTEAPATVSPGGAVALTNSFYFVTDESGRPVRGVQVTGRFLDDYWLDEEVSATTRFRGVARFVHRGPACVGAVAFVVTELSKAGHRFERTQGKLTGFVIPLPRRR